LFGKLLTARPSLRDEIIIQSKCGIQLSDGVLPARHNFSREHILSSVDDILLRLGTEYLDILLLHRPDPLVDPHEVAEAIRSLKTSGKVRHFGVSNMHSGQINYLRSAVDEPFIVNQLQMSLTHTQFIDQGLLYNRNEGSAISFEYGLMEYMQMEKIQIQAWGPLEQGRLTSTTTQHSSEAEQLTSQYIAYLAEQKQTTREAIALGWLMKHPASIQPVLGTTNVERIVACQDAARQAELMTRDEWWALYATSKGTHKPQLARL
jgi:predicted oxidoreductase